MKKTTLKTGKAATAKKFGYLRVLVIGLLAVACLGGGAAVLAGKKAGFFARPQVNVTLSGTVEREKAQIKLEKAEEVRPGEVLHWTINSENIGDGAASDYKVVGKIPAGTEFVANSAKAAGAPVVTYSIDGGKSYSKQPMIEEKQADGSVKLVPAPVSMYSNLRFEWSAGLNPSESLSATYDVRVK